MTQVQLACPRRRCNRARLGAGVLPQCPDCHGVWIPEAVLHDRIATQQQSPPRLAWRHETRAVVGCLVCANPMEALCLYDIPVDRCRGHGIWLDGGELEHVLDACRRSPVATTNDSGIAIVGDVAGTAVEVGAEATIVVVDSTLGLANVVGGAVSGGGGGVAEGVADGAGSVLGVVGDVVGTIASGTVSVVGSIAEGIVDGIGSILDF